MAQYSAANTLIDRIKDLAERGYTDPEIATRVGLKREAVGAARRRYGIPSAVAAGFPAAARDAPLPLPNTEAARLREREARRYHEELPRAGICARCRRTCDLDSLGRLVGHPANGTTRQMGRPCGGSWSRPDTYEGDN